MFVAFGFLSFVFGVFAAFIWAGREKKLKKNSITIPDGFSVVVDRIRKASFPKENDDSFIALEKDHLVTSQEGFLMTKAEVEVTFDASSWQRLAYDDFKTTILAKGTGLKTFPCVYATMGYRSDDHRYLFLKSDDPSEPQNVRLIGSALKSYLDMARSLGPNTSLVIMGAPSSSSKSVEEYNGYFWDMLRGLRIHDPCAWPGDVPSNTASEKWTFCYNGEAVFPVMLTPAHSMRYSRHMPVPIVALQPKWVLDQLLSTTEKRTLATGKVRKLLKEYDSIGISPDLTSFGDPGTSESHQLCLNDANVTVRCPYEDLDI